MKIKKGILSPYQKRETEYSWQSMEVGDSVFLKKRHNIEFTLKNLNVYADCNGGVFSYKYEKGGVRIWKEL